MTMLPRKKRVELFGSLEYPLAIGYAAFIKKLDGDPIRTSAVKHFITLPSGTVYIETENTHYILKPLKARASKGVRA